MDDSFNFGAPSKRKANLGRAPKKRGGSRSGLDPRLAFGVVGLLVVGAAVFAFMSLMDSGGKQIAKHNEEAVSQVAGARDEQAKVAARAAVIAARGVAAGGPYSTVTTDQLKAFDPSLEFTGSASTGPTVVSIASTDEAFAAAVLADSGNCFYEVDSITNGASSGTLPAGSCSAAGLV